LKCKYISFPKSFHNFPHAPLSLSPSPKHSVKTTYHPSHSALPRSAIPPHPMPLSPMPLSPIRPLSPLPGISALPTYPPPQNDSTNSPLALWRLLVHQSVANPSIHPFSPASFQSLHDMPSTRNSLATACIRKYLESILTNPSTSLIPFLRELMHIGRIDIPRLRLSYPALPLLHSIHRSTKKTTRRLAHFWTPAYVGEVGDTFFCHILSRLRKIGVCVSIASRRSPTFFSPLLSLSIQLGIYLMV